MFHMNKLIENGYVDKKGSIYKLTDAGKEYANKLDVSSVETAHQAKVTTVICCVRDGEDKDNPELLIYKRLKNPFYGCFGFPTRKVLFGDSLEKTVVAGLKSETGLEPTETPQLFAIKHYLIYSNQEELLEDKLMHAYMFINPKGELDTGIEGKFFWIPEKDLKERVIKPQEEFWEIHKALKKFDGKVTFEELKTTTENF